MKVSEKRFTFVDNTFKYFETGIKDNKSDYDSLNGESVVDLLNELAEENEQLKKYCTVLKNQIKKMGELGGFNKHLIKTIWESNYDD